MANGTAQFREDIISTARRFFIEQGTTATSMSSIGDALDLSKPMIYALFENKDALILAAVNSAIDDFDMSLTTSATHGEISFAQYLRRLPADYLDIVQSPKRSAIFRLMIQDGIRQSINRQPHKSKSFDPMYTTLSRMLDVVMANGQCRTMDHAIAIRMIMSPLYSIMFEICLFCEETLDAQATLDYFETFVDMQSKNLLPNVTSDAAENASSLPERNEGAD